MSDDATMEEKQNFLRETILEKGYDVNQFIEFLIEKKGEGGADVSVWSMHDLQIVVQEFIQLNGGEIQDQQEQQEQQEQYEQTEQKEEPQVQSEYQEPMPEPQSSNQQEIEKQKIESKPEPEEEKKEVKVEKKIVKKVSMFDVMPENKNKSEPIKPKVEPQKPQAKLVKATPIKEKDLKPEFKKQISQQPIATNLVVNNNTGTKPRTNTNINKVNKNVNVPSNAPNRSVSMALVGSESEYGVISPEIKKCKPTDKTQLGKYDNVEITVSNPEKKESGFLKKTHVTYLITTLPINFRVRRKFSDINWFRQALLNSFPTNLIPAVPRKSKFGADTLADAYIQKRARGAQRFFNYLVQDPNIKDSQILLDFLFIGSEADFNSKKKVYENIKNITEVKDFKSKEEKVNLLISGQNENYLENIKDNMNININLFKKLNNSFKLLFEEMNAVVSRMEEISNHWAQIHKVSLKYYDNNSTCESYKQLGNLFKTWSNILKQQNTVVHIDIREHFKFMRKNFYSMKEFGNSVEPIKSNYQKLVKNLMSKKEDLFKKGELNNNARTRSDFNVINNEKLKAFQSMLPKETNNAINAKEMYGLYLNRAMSEYERMRTLNGKLNKQIVLENVTKLMNLLSQFHITVGEINTGMETAALSDSNSNKCKERRIPLDESLLK